ncbi:MAG: recombinase family protein, partial [Chloroflexi bacterium SZAS-1]|nr:recombinase family protein [Chloroflexi bacterium SZAS-1]
VSTDKQAKTGYGLEAQLQACQVYVRERGYTLVCEPFVDIITGTTSHRPALESLLETITTQDINVVVMPEIDRQSRDYAEFVVIDNLIAEAGARVEYAIGANFDNNDEDSWLMKHLLAMLAHRERLRILRKTRDGIVAKVMDGQVFCSRPPYGYKLVALVNEQGKRHNYLVACDEEAVIVIQIFDWYIGGDSVYAIAQRLTKMGIPTRADDPAAKLSKRVSGTGEWSERMVRLILSREEYTGIWFWGKTKSVKKSPGSNETKQVAVSRSLWKSATIPAIIERDTFDVAQQIAQDHLKRAQRNGKYNYLFTGRLICKQCGYAMVGHRILQPKKPNYEYVYYRHSRKLPASAECINCNATEAEIDSTFWRWIVTIASHPETIEEHLAARQQQSEERNRPLQKQVEILDREIKEIEKERDNLQLMLVREKITESFFDSNIKRVEKQIIELTSRRTELKREIEDTDFSAEQIAGVREFCAMIREGLKGLTREERRLTYEVLDVSGELTVEDSVRVIHATCILDVRRLPIGPDKNGDAGLFTTSVRLPLR